MDHPMMKAFPVFTEIPLAPEVRHLTLEERVRLLEKQGLDREIRILTLEEELEEALLTVGTVGKKVDLLNERVEKLENSQSEILINLGEYRRNLGECVRKTNEVHEELDSTLDQISECQGELNVTREELDSIFEQVRTMDMLSQHTYEKSLDHDKQFDRQMMRMNELENAMKRLRGHTDQEIQSLAEKVKENRAEFDHLGLYLEVGKQDNVMDRLYACEQIRLDESYLSVKLNDLEKVVECMREIMKNAHQMFGNDLRELQYYCEDNIRRITDHLELDSQHGIGSRFERCDQSIELLEFLQKKDSNWETDEVAEQARREEEQNLLEKEKNDYIDYCCIHDLEPDMEMFDRQIESDERTTLPIAPTLSEFMYDRNFPTL